VKSKSFFKKWTKYIVEGQIDSDNVVKVVLYNDKNEVLFLKRTDYVDAYKGEWDLPGGHAHIGEDIVKALRREVREETKLSFKKPIKIKKIGNITFYKAKYDGGDIKLSKEHSEFLLRNVKNIKKPTKFEKVAKKAIKND